jgi:hypothetical protein
MATPTTLPATFVAGAVLTAEQQNDLRGAFRIMQVASTTKTDTFSLSSATFTDVTGFSVAITPAFTTSKVLVVVTMNVSANWNNGNLQARLMRDSTAIAIGDAAGSRTQASNVVAGGNNFAGQTVVISFLDSPATTSSTTYKVQIRGNTANTTVVNRDLDDTDSAQNPRTVSTISVFEVSA